MDKIDSALMIPLYILVYIEDVTTFEGLPERAIEGWKEMYSEEQLQSIYRTILWGIAHPEHNFQAIMPYSVRHSNEDIHLFLCKLGKSFGIA